MDTVTLTTTARTTAGEFRAERPVAGSAATESNGRPIALPRRRREEIDGIRRSARTGLGVLGVVLGIKGRKTLGYLLSGREERQSGDEGGVLARTGGRKLGLRGSMEPGRRPRAHGGPGDNVPSWDIIAASSSRARRAGLTDIVPKGNQVKDAASSRAGRAETMNDERDDDEDVKPEDDASSSKIKSPLRASCEAVFGLFDKNSFMEV